MVLGIPRKNRAPKVDRRGRVVRTYYLFQFFFTLLFWTPIFFEFQKRMGLSDAENFRVQSVYYAFFCLFEIPTGYFADRFGYRLSMKFGAILLVVSNLCAIFATNFWGFAAHWVLIAAARSFVSGASSAYLYEYLRRGRGDGIENRGASRTDEFKRFEGDARAYSLLGRILCFAIIGYLMEWKLTLPYWLTAGSATISIFYAWALPSLVGEGQETVTAADPRSYAAARANRPSLFAGFVRALRSGRLLLLMFQGVVLFVLARIIAVNLFQPILGGKGYGVETYGLVMAGMTLFEAIGAFRPGVLGKKVSDIGAVSIFSVGMAISILLVPFLNSWGTLVMLGFYAWVSGASYPLQRQVMNDAIPDPDLRATLLSLESLIDRAVTALVALSLQSMAGRLNSFLVTCGAVSILVTALIHLWIVRSKSRSLSDVRV